MAPVLYLFDIDGTLLHARGSGRAAFDAVMEAHHGVSDASMGIRYGGKTDPALIDEIYRAHLAREATAAEREAFLAAYVPRLSALLARDGVEVLPGAFEVLAWLAGQDVILGIATGNVREGAEAKLAAAGLADRFRLGGYGCDSPTRAELVAAAIARAGAVREVVVVGDTIHDISAARACGATVCAVTTGGDTREKLGHADVVFDSLAELPAWHAARFL